jgi:hypothetical protein
METFIRRFFTILVFIVVLISPIIAIESILYFFRFTFTGVSFPKDPYSFVLLKRMWK